MSRTQHGIRIAALMVAATAFLGWMAARSEVLFADGLRYVAQAQQIEAGARGGPA